MTKDEVITRFCKLECEVSEHLGWQHAADCFCGHGGFYYLDNYSERDYRNEGVSLEFIEEAVREKINREKKKRQIMKQIEINNPNGKGGQ